MLRSFLVLAVLDIAAWAQAPIYTADGIVNASDYSPGPFAPNSVLSIFGANLSWYTHALTSNDIAANTVPTELEGVSVTVNNWVAPVLYVSGPQINFIVPGNCISGNITIRVTREGVTGPEVTVTLVDAAPAMFDIGTGYAIATHLDGSLISTNSPAHAGENVVLYATGLGPTQPNPSPGQIPQTAASILWLNTLVVSLDSTALPSSRIEYAGATPLSVGLYQINIALPLDVGSDPEIQVTVGGRSNAVGLKIAVQ